MDPMRKTTEWLRSTVANLPEDLRMIYVESGESTPPGPGKRVVAKYELFGFRSIPCGGFDPTNDEHIADLGDCDWEAPQQCRFDEYEFEDHHWMEVLKAAAQEPVITELFKQRNLLLLVADHDGEVTVAPVGTGRPSTG